jgi:hypothetical protein
MEGVEDKREIDPIDDIFVAARRAPPDHHVADLGTFHDHSGIEGRGFLRLLGNHQIADLDPPTLAHQIEAPGLFPHAHHARGRAGTISAQRPVVEVLGLGAAVVADVRVAAIVHIKFPDPGTRTSPSGARALNAAKDSSLAGSTVSQLPTISPTMALPTSCCHQLSV